MGWLFSKHAYKRFSIQRTLKLEIASELSMTVINISFALKGRGLSIQWPRKYQWEIMLNSSWDLTHSPKLLNPAPEMTQPPEMTLLKFSRLWFPKPWLCLSFLRKWTRPVTWGRSSLAIIQSGTGYPVNQGLVLPQVFDNSITDLYQLTLLP